MKKILALLLALLLGAAPCAMASTGDVTVYYLASENGWGYYSVDSCLLVGDQVIYVTGPKLYVYDMKTRETAEYDAGPLTELNGPNEEGEDAWSDDDMISTYREIAAWFVYKGEAYAILNTSVYNGDSRTVEGGNVYRLALADGSASLAECDLPRLDWSSMIETYGEYMYSRWMQCSFVTGDSLVVMTSDDDGNSVLEVFDLTTGRARERYLQDLYLIAPAGDRILTFQYMWGDEQAHIGLYDPSSESLEPRADYAVDTEYYTMPYSICYREENDTLYYVLGGEIWAAPGFDFAGATAVNDCPISSSNGVVQMTDDGFMLLWDYQTCVLRNTDPSQRAEITLYVKDYSYVDAIDRAYYDYTNLHGDISMVISRNGRSQDILQAMMNRDASVDIYCMDVSESQYSAVFERGYMAELDSSAKLTAKVDSMYPAISESVKKNGSLYAVPVYAYGYTMGVNTSSLEALGMTQDDLPKTWDGFFDFLADLPEKLEGTTVRAFDSWYDRKDLSMTLFNTILQSYQAYINAGEAEYAFNTPLLRDLLHRLEEVDFAALDVLETNYDEETETWYDNYDERTSLFTGNVSTVMQSWYEGDPLLLSFGDEPPRVSFNMRVVFVNPFSAHMAESIEFLELVLDSITQEAQYTFYPDCNEPLHYPDYEEYKVNLVQWLEDARKMRDELDEDDQSDYDEYIQYLENEMANIEDTYWMFSPKAIEAYQKRAQYLAPMTYVFTNDMIDEDESFYTIFERYYEGSVSVEELLAAIDKKVQMMRLEGM